MTADYMFLHFPKCVRYKKVRFSDQSSFPLTYLWWGIKFHFNYYSKEHWPHNAESRAAHKKEWDLAFARRCEISFPQNQHDNLSNKSMLWNMLTFKHFRGMSGMFVFIHVYKINFDHTHLISLWEKTWNLRWVSFGTKKTYLSSRSSTILLRTSYVQQKETIST